VIGLSVPFIPRRATRPTTTMPRTDDAIFYQLYFQEPGVAEAELGRDPRETIRRLLYYGSGDARRDPVAPGSGDVAWSARRGLSRRPQGAGDAARVAHGHRRRLLTPVSSRAPASAAG